MSKAKPPNILLFMVDELRYPPAYDGPVLREWMRENLVAQRVLRERGVEFHRHYAQSVACAPSRTSIFTGQYPSLHGVTQTDGIGKHAWDPMMSWLDPDTVPTMGDWFRAAGYETYYKGKWHISFADILVPGTKTSLATNDDTGELIPANIERYRAGDRLDDFGFTGWIGPEPHGKDKANSGWVRDPLFMNEALAQLEILDARKDDTPWLLVNSYVNPHDIVFSGIVWKWFGFPVPEGEIPRIPPPPTQDEDLSTKPSCQASYVEQYPQMLLPQPTDENYRQFYYFLQAEVERYVLRVYERLMASRFRDDTIIVFTSDHGELLGAHGGMHQKWYQAYEEALHVPLIVSGTPISRTPRRVDGITSHADLIPTLLGLAGVDVEAAQRKLEASHAETRALVGRDLSAVVEGRAEVPAGEPVYFMTADDVAQGLKQITGRSPWRSVVPPNQIEAIVVEIDGVTWKYARYFEEEVERPNIGNPTLLKAIELNQSVPDQYEMYNLSADAFEQCNLVHPGNETAESIRIRPQLEDLLCEQRKLKRLTPRVLTGTTRAVGGEGLLQEAVL